MNRNFIQCKIHKDEKNTVRSDSSVHPWMRMFLRVRIANLILEVVVDHPNQSFNRTVKIHCRWLDYVLSEAGRFLIDSNIRVRIANLILKVVRRSSKSGVFLQPLDHHQET
ncbi:hypothetical protein T4D_14206 [Trichinella pseudospiralis]|uniref:Uncharacterized protein n=1 Tax=Trichinella pseudospiralis TaxID=6337 RepID=A0A0V1G2H9_TRIPS|nr:hypothetical protein T4D_14206 [Trichinella pseudospiralis]